MLIPIIAPRLGEGLHNIRLIKYIKNPGDSVVQDECIVLVETDKAVMEIESPAAGFIENWQYELGSEIPVGKEIGFISPSLKFNQENNVIRQDDRNMFLSELKKKVSEMRGKNSSGEQGRRRYKSHENIINLEQNMETKNPAEVLYKDNGIFNEKSISPKQQKLIVNLASGSLSIIPATISIECEWSPIRELKAYYRRKKQGTITPSSTEILSWCIAQAVNIHPKLRSLYFSTNKIREFHDTNIGIAVALPSDELETIIISYVNRMTFDQFVSDVRNKVSNAKRGESYSGYCSVLISDLSALGISNSIPVVVSPAVATVAINLPKKSPNRKEAFSISMTFDHRVINGAGAAKFLTRVKSIIKALPNSATRRE